MTTKTTMNLALSRLDRWRIHAARYRTTALTLAAVAILLFAREILNGRSAPVAAVPTPALAILIATSMPVPPSATPAAVVAAVLPNTLSRAVVAYDAPAGNVIGAIEQGRAYTVLARYGADWLQADVSGSGVVWLRADEVLDLPADLADLKPAPQPQVVYVASQPAAAPTYDQAAPQPVYDVPAADPYVVPTIAPYVPYIPTPVPPVVRAEDFVQPDPKAKCAFVGCL